MFGLGRPHQAPHRSACQVGDVLTLQRHGTPGGYHQHSRVMFGQPRLHGGQRLVGTLVAPGDRIFSRSNGFENFVIRVGAAVSGLRRRPRQLEKPVRPRAGHRRSQLLRTDRARNHAGHRQHRQSQVVRKFDRHRGRTGGSDPYPRGGGSRGVQRHALPGERQHQFGVRVGYHRGVQCRIQQRRVHPESGDAAGLLRQPHFGEHFLAAGPHRGQSAKCRAVAISTRRQPLVAVHRIHRDGAHRGPHRQVGHGIYRPSAQGSLGVADPYRTGSDVGSRVDRDAALAGLRRGTDDHLHRYRPRRREQQRASQGQFVDHRAADFVAGADCQLHKSRTRKYHRPGHRVIGQPSVCAGRQATRQHHAARRR
ncbi:hypothetical protein MYBA111488_24470 [Mycobacterium basiliense]